MVELVTLRFRAGLRVDTTTIVPSKMEVSWSMRVIWVILVLFSLVTLSACIGSDGEPTPTPIVIDSVIGATAAASRPEAGTATNRTTR